MKTFLRAVGLASALVAASTAAQASTNFASYLKCRHTTLTEFPGTIVEAAVATPELSTLVSLVSAAGLVDVGDAGGLARARVGVDALDRRVGAQRQVAGGCGCHQRRYV